jgi:hypothetical protein
MRYGEVVVASSQSTPAVPHQGRSRKVAVKRALDWADRKSVALERHGLLLFVALSGLYWVVTAALASRKLMWNDELYTYYVAMLPSMRDVWAALLSGGEQTPPFFYFTTRVAIDALGASNISIRVPQMFGFWVMSVSLLVLVKRRTLWMPALCAAAFPLVTMAYHYAFEARAYGLVLGFAGVALVSWQSAALGRRRLLSLMCLAVSLAAAVSSHYYAIFLILPLALGEITRALGSRHLDLPIFAALAFPAVPLALHLPLIRAGQAYSGAFWSPPQWINVPDFYAHLLNPALVGLTVILVLAIVHALVVRNEESSLADIHAAPFPVAEVVAACGFVVIPFVSVVVAKAFTGAFTYRYALPSVLGFAVLAGFGAAAVFRKHALMRVTVVGCLAGWFALSQARELIYPTGFSLPISVNTIRQPAEWLKTTPGDKLPFVVADPHSFAVLSHYGPPEMKSRIVYLADPDLALKELGHNSVERGMLDLLKRWFGMNVMEFEPFVAQHSQFLVYGDFYQMAFLNWITAELQRRGMRLELLHRQGADLFLLASRSDGAAAVATLPDEQHLGR